jgi:hypothetical protein
MTAGTNRRTGLLLSLSFARGQLFLRRLRLGQGLRCPQLRLAQAHASPPQRVKMISLIHDRRPVLLLTLRVHQGHAFFQAFSAIPCHLFQVRQAPKLLLPRLAADFVRKLTTDPAQALRFHDHQHWIFDVDFIRRRAAVCHCRAGPALDLGIRGLPGVEAMTGPYTVIRRM